MPAIDLHEVVASVRLLDALALLRWPGRGLWGDNHRGPCPVRGCIHRYRQPFWCCNERWYCHKCKQGGDVLDLWAAVNGMSLFEAARDLCRAFALDVPYLPRGARKPRGGRKPRPAANREEDG